MESTVPALHFVRCFKCLKILAELPGVPVYKCGGCGAIIRAKMRSSHGETLSLASAASSSKNLPNGSGSPDTEIASFEQQTQFSSDSPNVSGSEDGMKAHAISESNGESLKEKIKSPEYEENRIRGIPLETEQGILTTAKNSLNEEGKISSDQEIVEDNDSLKSSDILEESSESLEHHTITEDNKIYGNFTSDFHAYDGSISSTDEQRREHVPQKYLSFSRRTFRKRYVSNSENSIKEAEEDALKNSADAGAQPLVRKNSRKLSFVGISSSVTGKATFRNGDRAREQNLSFVSEDFHSAVNLMESENDAPSISQSKAVKFRYSEKGDQVKILKKVDELRNELLRFFIRAADGKEASRVSISSHFEGKVPPKQYRSSLIPLSKQTNSSGLHPNHGDICCRNKHCRHFPHNACYHLPEGTTSKPLHMKRSPSLHQDRENQQSNDRKPQTIKRHCRPVSGGAPFVMCYRCYNLLQLPVDFLVSTKRVHMLRCGSCSEILRYSFRPRTRSMPWTLAQALHPPSVVENNEILVDEIKAPPSTELARGDPTSFSVEFGSSFGKSNSYEAEPTRNFARCDNIVEEEQSGKESSGSKLHKLMGYSSARYLLFESLNAGEGHRTGHDR